MNPDRRVALVTGGARRVGRAIALRLARRGYDIALHYARSEQDATDTAGACREHGIEAECFAADFADIAAPPSLGRCVLDRFGRLDALVNNASIFEQMRLEDFDPQAWDRTLRINLTAAMTLTHALADALRATRGRIVNLCDAATPRSWPDHLAYITSKGALETLTRALARALAPDVLVNGVAPGIAAWPARYDEATRQRLLQRMPLQRAGTPDDVAGAVEFFVCDADYVTGVILPVDGGRGLV